jgi:hypothetical protein
MLELRAQPLEHVDLRERAVQQRLLLSDIQSRGRAQVVPRGREFQRAPLQREGAGEDVEFDVERAQVEVRDGEIRGQQQPDVLEVGGRLLRRRARPFDQRAARGRQVRFVA